jgi:hypothetical protein
MRLHVMPAAELDMFMRPSALYTGFALELVTYSVLSYVCQEEWWMHVVAVSDWWVFALRVDRAWFGCPIVD